MQPIVSVSHLSKTYRNGHQALKDVSLDIEPGEILALLGPNGAGKSTLINIMTRYYDIESGTILIDGQDLRGLTQDSLRAAIGIVPQDTVLFNDSILYNLAYGRPTASRAEIEEAAEMAHIRGFIESSTSSMRSDASRSPTRSSTGSALCPPSAGRSTKR